jgi:hypothetical protein
MVLVGRVAADLCLDFYAGYGLEVTSKYFEGDLWEGLLV